MLLAYPFPFLFIGVVYLKKFYCSGFFNKFNTESFVWYCFFKSVIQLHTSFLLRKLSDIRNPDQYLTRIFSCTVPRFQRNIPDCAIHNSKVHLCTGILLAPWFYSFSLNLKTYSNCCNKSQSTSSFEHI